MAHRIVILAALVLVAAACGDDDVGAPTATDDQTTTTEETTTTTEGTTTTSLPGGDLTACESPMGFTVSAPADWATNDGGVVPACTMFNPTPFEVQEGTDARVAAITADIEPVAFSEASAPRQGRDEDRAVTVVQGRQATRLAYEADGQGLYPEGTPITAYLVDVQPEGGDPATLFLDAVGVGEHDHETSVVVLDRMLRTVDVSDLDVEADPATVATYLGGGGGFSVTAEDRDDEVCLRIPPEGEAVCTDHPAVDQVHTIALRNLDATVQAGVTGEDVWRVDLVTTAGETHSYLPVEVPDTDVRAYAFHDAIEDFERLVLRDITGEELRTVEPGAA